MVARCVEKWKCCCGYVGCVTYSPHRGHTIQLSKKNLRLIEVNALAPTDVAGLQQKLLDILSINKVSSSCKRWMPWMPWLQQMLLGSSKSYLTFCLSIKFLQVVRGECLECLGSNRCCWAPAKVTWHSVYTGAWLKNEHPRTLMNYYLLSYDIYDLASDFSCM
jgi:hypothetical protein